MNMILADRAACRSSGQASHRAVSPSSRVAIMLAASASALSRTATSTSGPRLTRSFEHREQPFDRLVKPCDQLERVVTGLTCVSRWRTSGPNRRGRRKWCRLHAPIPRDDRVKNRSAVRRVDVETPSHILHSRARNVLEEEIEHKKAIAKPASLAKFDKFQNHTTLSHSGTRIHTQRSRRIVAYRSSR